MSESAPLVSILVPVYGVEAFIERCARTLFEQTFKSIEYVFVNDCTPDNSMQVLENVIKDYPERADSIKIIHHAKNSGIAVVRNTLLANATGNYVIFIDSDDWVESNMIEKLYQKATHENADITGYDYFLTYPDHEVRCYTKYSTDNATNFRDIISLKIKAYTCFIFVRRALYTDNDITFVPGINVGEDYIINVKLYYYSQKTVALSEPLYHYVQYNPENYSRLSLQNIQDRINAVQVVERFCQEKAVADRVQQEIDGRKLIIKNPFLMNDDFIDYNRWADTFPEANYAWRQFNFGASQKITYWLAERHAFGCIKLIKSIKKLLKI